MLLGTTSALRVAKHVLRRSCTRSTAGVRFRLAGQPCIGRTQLAPAYGAFRHVTTGFGGLQYDTLVEMQQRACEKYNDRMFLGERPKGGGPFHFITFKEFDTRVNQARSALVAAGIKKGDKVAAISCNCIDWAVSAYATFSIGAIFVPMYEQQRLKECEYILTDSGATLLLVSKERILDKVRPFLKTIPTLKDVWCFELDFQSRLNVTEPEHCVPAAQIAPDDVSTLIYTSGTTGTPKGVQLTHRNLTADVKGMGAVIRDDDIPVARSVAFLPWAHCFGKTCELHNAVQRGAQVAIVDDLAALPAALLEVKPTMLYSVPTLFKRIYDKVQEKIAAESSAKRYLINRALKVGEKRRLALMDGRKPGPLIAAQHGILDKLVLSKFRAPLGGELGSAYVGGSAMPVEVANFFENVGIGICEGYGLTETSPLICVNPFNIEIRRTGTVGQLIGDADVKIVKNGVEMEQGQEGEVWVRGPFVFKGYYNKPTETEETFGMLNGQRYFKTGDLGTLVVGGKGIPLLKITGRMKELYKLENGKYVVPALIEKAISENDLFTQVLVYGSNRPYNIAMIVPNWEKLKSWALKNAEGLKPESTKEEIGANHTVQAYLDRELHLAAKERVKKYELPTKVLLLKEPWTVENECLTQKLSIKRHVVTNNLAPDIEKLYAESEKVRVV